MWKCGYTSEPYWCQRNRGDVKSGCDDETSRSVLFQLKALGTEVVVIKGDVTKLNDVRNAFQQGARPIAGVVQGAMVLRVRYVSSFFITVHVNRIL